MTARPGNIYHQVAEMQTARERRRTIRFLTFWERLKGLRDMPRESEIDPEGIELLPFWDHAFIVDAASLEAGAPQYRHLGTGIVDSYHEVLSLEDPGNLVSPAVTKLLRAYARVAESAAPYIDEGQFVGKSGKLVKYRQCLVPLGEKMKVDAILGFMCYMAVGRDA